MGSSVVFLYSFFFSSQVVETVSVLQFFTADLMLECKELSCLSHEFYIECVMQEHMCIRRKLAFIHGSDIPAESCFAMSDCKCKTTMKDFFL
jgi:hypothetical protein